MKNKKRRTKIQEPRTNPAVRRALKSIYHRFLVIGSSFLVLGSLVFVCGCGSKPAAKPVAAPPFAGATLRITAPATGPARELLNRYAVAWARLQKAKLEFVDQDADLIVFAPAELGRLAESGTIAPLPEAATNNEHWNGLTRLYRHKLLLWGDKPYAFPILGDGTILIYRVDIFRDAKRKPPATFAEFATTAQQFAAERKRSSLPNLPSDDDELDRIFHVAAAAFAIAPVGENDLRRRPGEDSDTAKIFSFHRDVHTGEPRLTDPGFVAALTWLKSIQPFRAKSGTFAENFAADDAVMALGSLSDLASLSPRKHPGKYAAVSLPAGPNNERVPYIGPAGALIAVAKSSKNPATALALAQYLSGPTSMEVIHDPVFGCAPFRSVHLSDHRDGWFNYGMEVADNPPFLEAVRVATEPRIVNAPLRLRLPDQQEYRRVLLDGVRKCLTTNEEPATALMAIDARWREMDRANPMDRKTLYLRSLNLKP